MVRRHGYQYEMFIRVRDFGKERQHRFPEGSVAVTAFARVAAAVASVEKQWGQQFLGRAEASKLGPQARQTVIDDMKILVRTAKRLQTTGTPARMMRRPDRAEAAATVAAARQLVSDAAPYEAQFVAFGLPATFIQDYTAHIDRFEQNVATQKHSLTKRRDANAALAAALNDGMEAARDLDSIIPTVFRDEVPTIAAWGAARHIQTFTRRAEHLKRRKKPTPTDAASE